MQNEPNFSKSQMFITLIKTTNYNKKQQKDTWPKRTQTNPILPAYGGFIRLRQAGGSNALDKPVGFRYCKKGDKKLWRGGMVEKLKNKPFAGLFELNAPHISTGYAEKSIIGWSKKPSQQSLGDKQQGHPLVHYSAGLFDFRQFLQRLGNLVENLVSPVLMQHLPAAEEQCELDLVAFLQKFACVICLDFDVVLVGFGTQPDFLKHSGMMLAFFVAVANFAFLLVEPFAVIHYSADRRVAGGRNLDEVEFCLTSFIER